MKRLVPVLASALLCFGASSALAGTATYPKASFAGVIGGTTIDQQGRFTITTTTTGAFTVKVHVGSKSATFRGEFDENFHVDKTFSYEPIPFVSVDVRVIMDMTPDGERIKGTVQSEPLNNGDPLPFTVYQVFKYTTKNPAPQAGRFTGLFTKIDGTSPSGTGVASVSVSKTGKVKVVGSLPDGSKISTGGGISPGGVFPIFNVLYDKKGALAGFAQFHSNTAGDSSINVAGQTDTTGIIWAKIGNGEFTGHEKLVLTRYTPPAAGSRVLDSLNASSGAATLTLSGDGLGTPFTKTITISTSNKVAVASNDEGLKLKIDAKTGLITGSITLDIGGESAKRAINLVVIEQPTNTISGSFAGSTGPGEASIAPAPAN